MNKDRLYDLAYAFRDTKLWKKLKEEELFAVKLSADGKNESIAYCFIMGTSGEHTALAIYRGDKAFSTFREFAEVLSSGQIEPQEVLIQDCIQCSLESRELFDPDELAKLRAYCKKTDRPFRAPLPQFTKYYPFCTPWFVTEEADWAALEAALLVVRKMSAVIERSGKAALGLKPVFVSTQGEAYPPEQMDLFSDPVPDDDVTIPLYSIVNDELKIERVPLPPYEKRRIPLPKRVGGKTLEKLKRRKQKGVYQCELLRLPEPIDGEPSFFPVILLTVDEEGYLLRPTFSDGPTVDPDTMLAEFIENLNGAYPKAIKVRTDETKDLLEGFCRDANILLAISEDMPELDEAIDGLLGEMLDDDDEDDKCDDDDDYFDDDDEGELITLEETVSMLSQMSVSMMRRLPTVLLDQLLEIEDLLPPDIVKKLRKARGK